MPTAFPTIYRWLRWPLLLMAMTGLFLLAAWRLTQPNILRWDDTVEYWSAGRLNIIGQNPYDPDLLIRLEREVGRPLKEPLMMWNPPWLLALVMPIALLPYPYARAFWFLLHLSIVFFTSVWVAQEAGFSCPLDRGLAVFIGLSFGPTLYALKIGQVTPLMLLAPVGFAHYFRQKRWIIAGTMAAASLVKPHLLHLFLVAIFLDGLVRQRKTLFKIAFGMALPVTVSAGLATLTNPCVWEQYIYALIHYPPRNWATPTLGGFLRWLLGANHFWLQFLPSVLGVFWMFLYWYRHRSDWQWEQHLPLLVMVSVVTTAYGWNFDSPVMLVALIPVLLRLLKAWKRPAVLALLTTYLIADAVHLVTTFEQFFYFWMPLFFLGWYLLAKRVM